MTEPTNTADDAPTPVALEAKGFVESTQEWAIMLVSMVFQTLYVLIDLYWVGRLGTDAVAAVGLSGNLMFIVLAATQMLGVGTTTLVSHATGARNRDRANLVFKQSQVLSVVVGGLFFLVAMATRRLYAESLSADAATLQLTGEYLLWFIPALALQFGLIAMGSALRGRATSVPAWWCRQPRSFSTSCSRPC